MADDFLEIKTEGDEQLEKALIEFTREAVRYLSAAGQESADRVILAEQGLKRYPPATRANRPPTPYYIRGRGTQTGHGNRGNSERLGTRWYTRRAGADVELGNTASYAKWAHGEEQAWFMTIIGWKRLRQVAEDKIEQITKTYQAWVDKLLIDLHLR